MIRRSRSTTGRMILPTGAALLLSMGAGPARAQDPGEDLFRQVCSACHSAGSERVVGPGLAGVGDRRDHDWLLRKITEPDRLRAEGDSITGALAEEHGMAMPNLGITRDQAEDVLAYVAGLDAAAPVEPGDEPAEIAFTEEQVRLGRALFLGERRLENRGPSCSACHDAAREGALGGGSLAVSLSDAHARLGRGGIEAIIRNPPFPVMRRAYAGRPASDVEVEALLAFFQQLNAEPVSGKSPPYAVLLAGTGVLGSALLASLFSLAWRRRRRGSINQEIFRRQLRSR